jgi:uncharacterized membrane protein
MRKLTQAVLDRWFRIAVAIKGLDGIVEALSGAFLLIVPAAQIKGVIATLATNEIQENKHAFIAHFVLSLDQKVDVHVQLFVAIYLLAHGCIKIALAIALLKRYFRLYPYAMGFLVVFIVYQSYLITANHSLLLVALTLFDIAVTVLTYLEWQRHRNEMVKDQATA